GTVILLQFLSFHSFLHPTATTAIYTLSLHDALPISPGRGCGEERPYPLPKKPLCGVYGCGCWCAVVWAGPGRSAPIKAFRALPADRKSTRLNSSHVKISYAVFCLKKKKIINN